MPEIAITETLPEVNSHVTKFALMHEEIQNYTDVMSRAITEAWPNASPEEVLLAAQINSIRRAREKAYARGEAKMVDAVLNGQEDMFPEAGIMALRVPDRMKNEQGDWESFEQSPLARGFAWWAGLVSTRRSSLLAHEAAVEQARDLLKFAERNFHDHELACEELKRRGLDPWNVTYAAATHSFSPA